VDTIIRSRTRRRILVKMLLAPDREFYLRELARSTGAALRTVQVELNRLVGAGILLERRSGNRRYLRANERHPLYRSLRELVVRSDGLIDLIRASLGTEGIDLAFVFGSMAEGTAKSDSDVDVLIVGDLGLREAVRRLAAAQERLGREINPVVWTREEFERRQKSGDHFLSRIVAGSRLIIMGEGSDLAAVDG